MTRAHSLACFALIQLLLTAAVTGQESGKVTSLATYLNSSGTIDGKTYGFCGLCALEIDGNIAASFGLYQALGQKSRYTFLILYKVAAKSKRSFGQGGEGTSTAESDGQLACDLKLQARPAGREINLRLQLERDAQTVTKDILTIGGKEYDKNGPRVFLIDLAETKPVPLPITFLPTAVPDFADEEAWGKQILAARKELIEKSPEAKKFFDETEEK